MIEVCDVSKRYDAPGNGEGLEVLRDVSLEVQAGESLAIVGPSGSGKSTLLHIIGTLDRPTSGQVRFCGRDLAELGETELAAFRNREIGFVFQAHYLLPQCTVLENVLVPTLASSSSSSKKGEGNSGPTIPDKQLRPPRESPARRAQRLLARVGLADRLTHRPGQLSGGERQRVAVVRALINQPKLILADEPTGALDQTSAEQLGRLLSELNKEEQVTLVVVTHSRELAGRMQRVLQLKNGCLAPLNFAVPNPVPAEPS